MNILAARVSAPLAAWGRMAALGAVVSLSTACAVKPNARVEPPAPEAAAYAAALQRADVWQPTRVRAMNLRQGPQGPGSFRPNQTVTCTYVPSDMGGKTPKFACALPNGDKVRVKYGHENGEVFAEVAASRLLWALGFGADRVYPVRVVCKGCPPMEDEAGVRRADGTTLFEFATIERRMPGREIEGPKGPGWAWDELDEVHPGAPPDVVAHRDALKLLAVVLQHTDSKREQQRMVCLGPARGRDTAACARPFLLIDDLGKTFGKANLFNRDKPGSVNLKAWSDTPVWADASTCTANLPKSLTGTLSKPAISEEGRKFLAGLLAQLTDRQLRDLFDVARFPARRSGDSEISGEVQAWVQAFKQKVAEVSTRSCEPARGE